MIIVNFKIVFGQEGNEWLQKIAHVFDGKAAATFVVLAGTGIGLISKSAVSQNDLSKIRKIHSKVFKRAFFLFIIGLSYTPLWPADILHFYGVYLVITALLIRATNTVILSSAFILIFVFPLLMLFLNYEAGWDFEALAYTDFWSLPGFFRNLFYNGFHPVIPWAAFMLTGLWFGKLDLHNNATIKKCLWVSASVFISVQLLSYGLSHALSSTPQERQEWLQIIGTSPMPPLPLYMISGNNIAIAVISSSILLGRRYGNNLIMKSLVSTGQLALTFYVAHVIIGMGIIEAINPDRMGDYGILFSLVYALSFSLSCVVFAILWKRWRADGPLEWVMRKILG